MDSGKCYRGFQKRECTIVVFMSCPPASGGISKRALRVALFFFKGIQPLLNNYITKSRKKPWESGRCTVKQTDTKLGVFVSVCLLDYIVLTAQHNIHFKEQSGIARPT